MNAKKFLKALGIAALVAAVTPYCIEKDEEKDELTVQALLWKVTNQPHPDFEDKRSTTLSFGIHTPDFGGCCCEDEDCCCDDDCCCDTVDCCCEETPAEEPVCECGCCCEEKPAE